MEFCVVMLLVLLARSAVCVEEILFVQSSVCNLQTGIQAECSEEMTNVHQLFPCLDKCEPEESCIGASLDGQGRCFHHRKCLSPVTCHDTDTRVPVWSKYCVHGIWDGTTRSCLCDDRGFIGDRCDTYPQFCKDLIPFKETGSYRTVLDPYKEGKTLIPVICYVNSVSGYWHTSVALNRGKQSFNKTWEEYENGFFIDMGHYWIGLNGWHILSQLGANKLIINAEFLTTNPNDRSNVYRYYLQFRVQNKENKFAFTFGWGGSGNNGQYPAGVDGFGMCMDSIQQTPFSTWDNDNDGDSNENCASRASSGWWRSGCDNPCNLLGQWRDDMSAIPLRQRFSVLGIDMNTAAPIMGVFQMYIHPG